MKKLILLLVIATVGFTSCKNKNEEEVEKINKVLMEGHDSLMPKTMGIADLKSDLAAAAEKAPEAEKTMALTISNDLQKAEDGMYEWMKNYGSAMNDVKDLDEKLKLYLKLEAEVKDLAKATDTSIEDAKKFIASHK